MNVLRITHKKRLTVHRPTSPLNIPNVLFPSEVIRVLSITTPPSHCFKQFLCHLRVDSLAYASSFWLHFSEATTVLQ